MKPPTWTVVKWYNRLGELRQQKLYKIGTTIKNCEHYARNWWRKSILESQGILSVGEKRGSKLALISIESEP